MRQPRPRTSWQPRVPARQRPLLPLRPSEHPRQPSSRPRPQPWRARQLPCPRRWKQRPPRPSSEPLRLFCLGGFGSSLRSLGGSLGFLCLQHAVGSLRSALSSLVRRSARSGLPLPQPSRPRRQPWQPQRQRRRCSPRQPSGQRQRLPWPLRPSSGLLPPWSAGFGSGLRGLSSLAGFLGSGVVLTGLGSGGLSGLPARPWRPQRLPRQPSARLRPLPVPSWLPQRPSGRLPQPMPSVPHTALGSEQLFIVLDQFLLRVGQGRHRRRGQP